ncbi:MAG: AAA family ATPase [Methanobrevibacter sp.]|nr:AAA family ATPase [Methanobrevibacter sp.]
MPGGLGKGLDSLIPDYYDEDFDSNGAQSLEDMLKEDNQDSLQTDSTSDKVDSESSVDDTSDSSVVDENVEEDIEVQKEEEEASDNEIQTNDTQDTQTSEDLPSNHDYEEDLSDTQEIKKQENVAEVLDIVDKNPRITLWSSRSAAVFRYLRKTEPEFSISREASILIDEAVSKKYPDIWKLFDNL